MLGILLEYKNIIRLELGILLGFLMLETFSLYVGKFLSVFFSLNDPLKTFQTGMFRPVLSKGVGAPDNWSTFKQQMKTQESTLSISPLRK